MPDYMKKDLLDQQQIVVDVAATKAVNSFKALTKKKGIWDIFVGKQKEVNFMQCALFE